MLPQLKSVHYVFKYADGVIVEFVDDFQSFLVECREYDPDPTNDDKVRQVTLTYMAETLNQARDFGIDYVVFETWE